MYDAYQVQVKECDSEVEKVLIELSKDTPSPPEPRHKTRPPKQFNIDVCQTLYTLTRTDLTQIHGWSLFSASTHF